MATYPIDAYALRKKLIDKYGLRLDLDGQEVLKGVIAEIRKMPVFKGYHNSKLSINDLRHLPDGKWVWIERVDQCGDWPSAYYQKESDFTRGRAFCCGYPNHSFSFDYRDYGHTWTAYQFEPQKGDA